MCCGYFFANLAEMKPQLLDGVHHNVLAKQEAHIEVYLLNN